MTFSDIDYFDIVNYSSSPMPHFTRFGTPYQVSSVVGIAELTQHLPQDEPVDEGPLLGFRPRNS